MDSDDEEEEQLPEQTGELEDENEVKFKIWRSFLMTNLFLRDVQKNKYTRLVIHRDYGQNNTVCFGTKNSDVRRDKEGLVEYKTYSLDEIKKRAAV
mmetsp:Transcript_13018/g.20195  ORF Transcript_13018/g.20195 Transcript_13018/m.20195 type:complete len:96 (+) Transcript_13018:735-1022(+)|eukprot:CAMPEP_0170498572 /NCGR_PEP_ID=MMETSP0208-20121228/28275_1 /TAXON_ID=197538 /ORGANISM="Strombidium inclinatum, Strain S3" /LENGTH=95 /DNA_ID=CAMNT_0010775795 /DNA_START=666 /DNA_END=953 /DNA_ORIENTATION=-